MRLASAVMFVVIVGAGLPSCRTNREIVFRDEDNLLPLGFPDAPASLEELRAWFDARADQRIGSFAQRDDAAYVEVGLGRDSDARIAFIAHLDAHRTTTTLVFLGANEPPPGISLGVVGHLCDLDVVALEGVRAHDTWWIPQLRVWLTHPTSADAALLGITNEAASCRVEERTWPTSLGLTPPPTVEMKDADVTFDRVHAFALVGGRLLYRSRARAEPWRLMHEGVPRAPDVDGAPAFEPPARVAAISSDGDELIAVDAIGRVYTHSTESRSMGSADGWTAGWGYPGKRALFLPVPIPRFALGRRAEHALFAEDAVGNAHHFGPMGTTTLYVLDDDGRAIHYTDNGLPPDLTREMCLPNNGNFVAENMSASASAVMVIDRYGRVFTQFFDYDLNGGTPFFAFSYDNAVELDEGTSQMTAFAPQQLPIADWQWHAPVPLEGAARLSRRITVVQTGEGNMSRELRIAAVDAAGRTGIFAKGIDDLVWHFVPSTDAVPPNAMLDVDAVRAGARDFDASHGDVHRSSLDAPAAVRATWSGAVFRAAGVNGRVPLDITLSADGFQPTCAPTMLHVSTEGRTFDVVMYAADLWTPAQRHGHLGEDGHPLLMQGTLVVPADVLRSTDPIVKKVVRTLLRPWHEKTFAFLVVKDGPHVDFIAENDDDAQLGLGFHLDVSPSALPSAPAPATLAAVIAQARALTDPTATAAAVARTDAASLANVLRDELRAHDAEIAEALAYLDDSAPLLFVARAVPIGSLPRMRRIVQAHIDHDPIASPKQRPQTLELLAKLDALASGSTGPTNADGSEQRDEGSGSSDVGR